MFSLKRRIEVGEALRHPYLQYVLSRPHSSRPISRPNRGLHPQDEPTARTSRYFILPFRQWRPHAKRRAQRSVPCIFLLCDSPSDARETVLIYEDITPWHSFPPRNFVFIIDTIICRTFIHPCSYILRFVLMYWHMIPIITLVLWAPRGVHEAPLYDQITDIPPLHFCAPSLVVRMLFLSIQPPNSEHICL